MKPPLEGLRIVVTRAAHQAEELAQPLRDNGAEVILLPVIGIAPPNDPEPLRTAAKSDAYDWIFFTSANAVQAFSAELRRIDRHCSARIATVGAATREAAEAHGFRVHLVPEQYVAESMLEAFGAEDLANRRILIPSAAITRNALAPALRERGARVDVVEAYRNVLPPEASARAQMIFDRPNPDWVTFASSSAVTNLVNIVGRNALNGSKLASIGSVTSKAIRSLGLAAVAEANPHTIEGLVNAIIRSSA